MNIAFIELVRAINAVKAKAGTFVKITFFSLRPPQGALQFHVFN